MQRKASLQQVHVRILEARGGGSDAVEDCGPRPGAVAAPLSADAVPIECVERDRRDRSLVPRAAFFRLTGLTCVLHHRPPGVIAIIRVGSRSRIGGGAVVRDIRSSILHPTGSAR